MEKSNHMKTLTLCLVLLAALPCAAGNRKTSDDLNVNRRHGGQNFHAAGSSVVWADATPNGQSVIWGSSVVWADAFIGGGEQTIVRGER
jgi:hypothetical protein